MIHHHPDDALLASLAAGTLPSGPALLVSTHIEGCTRCEARLRDYEAVGGVLLEEIEPALLAPQALARTLARLSPPEGRVPTRRRRAAAPAQMRARPPAGMQWPRSLQGCSSTPWRWLGPGMRWSRVTLPHDPEANVFFLRIGAGKSLPVHTHSDCEMTQILYGTFHDGRALFGPGDFDEADGSFRHQPVVEAGGECICIASVQGKVMFDGAVARWMGALVGM
jgi:putative transcriptional regulator